MESYFLNWVQPCDFGNVVPSGTPKDIFAQENTPLLYSL
jgi:hypothetical protein